MKVTVLTNLFPLPWEPQRATFNRQQFAHLAKLCELRAEIIVAWPDFLRHRSETLSTEVSGIPVTYQGYFYIPRFLRGTYADTLYYSLRWRLAHYRRHRPDCLLVSWAYPDGVAGVRLADRLGIPVVIKVHGSDVNVAMEHPRRRSQILESMQQADAIICVSRALRDRLQSAGVPANRLHLLYNGIDQTVFFPGDRQEACLRLGLAPERRHLLFVGNLKTEKGCVDLLQAFVRVAERLPDVDLHYVGAGRAAAELTQRAVATGLQHRIHLHGSRPHPELGQWFAASSVVTLPSHNEGVPNVLLEAMACGRPVVASRVGGIPEVVQPQAGVLVEPREIDGLAEALASAFNMTWDEQLIAQTMVSFSWEQNAVQLRDILRDATRQYGQRHSKKEG